MNHFKTQQEIWKYLVDGGTVIHIDGSIVKFQNGRVNYSFDGPSNWNTYIEPVAKTKVWREFWICYHGQWYRDKETAFDEQSQDAIFCVIEAEPALAEIESLRAEKLEILEALKAMVASAKDNNCGLLIADELLSKYDKNGTLK